MQKHYNCLFPHTGKRMVSFERRGQYFIVLIILFEINFFFYLFRAACHSSLFQAWETFLQEIEADSQSTSDVASALSRQVI